MKNFNRKNFRINILIVLLAVPSLVIFYLLVAILLAYIPINKNFKEATNGIDIYILDNGVHTDIVVPMVSYAMDWNQKLKPNNYSKLPYTYNYVAFGWGDKAFYINTPSWSDLRADIAIKAVMGMGPAAIHCVFFINPPKENNSICKIRIDEAQFKRLVYYIDRSFKTNGKGDYEVITSVHYKNSDNKFFNAEGRFSLIKSCNTWTNRGLKEAGIRTPSWTTFQWPIMMQLRKIEN